MSVSLAVTSAGTSISIGPAPATYDAPGFVAVTFSVIGEVTDIGTYGKSYKLVTHNPIADRKTVKRKGSYNNGTLALKMAKVTNVGQAAARTASDSDASFAFKIQDRDGNVAYFTGQVMSFMTNVGNVDQITAADVQIEIDNDIIEVAHA